MKHVHEVDLNAGMPLAVCKRGHSVYRQKYCKVCHRIFCLECQAGNKTVNQETIDAAQASGIIGVTK